MKHTFTVEDVGPNGEGMLRIELEDDFNEVYVTWHISREDAIAMANNILRLEWKS